MSTKDHAGSDSLHPPKGSSNSPSTQASAEDDEANSVQSELMMDERPWVVPAKGSTIRGTRGIELRSSDIFSPHQRAELEFYNQDGNRYIHRNIQTNGGAIVWRTDFELQEGRGRIHFRTWFANNSSSWFSSGEFNVRSYLPLPSIHFIPNFPDSPIVMSGTGEPEGKIVIVDAGGQQLVAGDVKSNGSWTLQCPVSGTLNTLNFRAYQTLGDLTSSQTELVRTSRAKITLPENNSILLVKDIVFTGIAALGTQIKVVTGSSDHDEWGSQVTVPLTGIWQMPMTKVPRSGPAAVKAQIKYGALPHFYSTVVNFFVLGSPRITAPAVSSIQDRTFTLKGDNGLSGFNSGVEVFLDSEMVGSGAVGAAGIWEVQVTLKPGNHSLAVEQIASGKRTERGAPRAFKIRPARIDDIKVEIIEKSITFSGTGYPGATVVITVPGSPVTLPQPVVAADGKWEIKATDLPLGKLPASILQKVSDNASGWIESLPYNFEINNSLPDVYAVSSTDDYQPTFSGKGFTGATVRLFNPGGGSQAAPEVVVRDGEWQSKASQQWGPTLNREVHIKQFLDRHQSLNWVKHPVTIPPQAPTIDLPVEDGLSPTFSGTCWPNALVNIAFNDDPAPYNATGTAGIWTFRRPTEFKHDITYTITVSQTVATQTSTVTTKSFTVLRSMITPVITHPSEESDVGHELVIKGSGGMKGATMQVRDVVYDKNLSASQVLSSDGDWEVLVRSLNLRSYGIEAHQSDKNRVSKSKRLNFNVVVLPPQITQPTAGGKLPRTAKLKGLGRPGARVQVWVVGATKPWLEDIVVRADGQWECEAASPVGFKNIRALQSFEEDGTQHHSRFTDAVQYSVVPAAPFVETPVAGQFIGQRVVVSGFGVPGDTVKVKLGAVQASATVMADRTWSMNLVLTQTGGMHSLEVTSALDEFESEAAQRPVVLGTFVPSIDIPAAGRRVENPLLFAGRGRTGVGEIVSWYDPDQKWLADVPVTGNGWRGQAAKPLSLGGQWVRFSQTLAGGNEGSHSAWVISPRFEVEPAIPGKAGL